MAEPEDERPSGYEVTTSIGDVIITPENSTIRMFRTGMIDRIDVDTPDGRVLCLFVAQELILELQEIGWPTIDSRPFTLGEKDIAIAEEYFGMEIQQAIDSESW